MWSQEGNLWIFETIRVFHLDTCVRTIPEGAFTTFSAARGSPPCLPPSHQSSFWGGVNMLPFWESVNQARKSQDFSIKPLESENYNLTSCCTNKHCVFNFLAKTNAHAEKYSSQKNYWSWSRFHVPHTISMLVVWMQRMSLWKVAKKDQVVRLKTTRIERRVVWLKSVEKEKYGGQEGRHLVSHLAT